MRGCRSTLAVLVLVAVAGCATRKPAPITQSVAAPAVDVAALVRHGCFHCLEQALDAARGEQAFEVAALLTLRAKELGLPSDVYRMRAEEVSTVNPGFATYLQIIDAVPVDAMSGERYLGDGLTASATRGDRGAPAAPVRQRPAAERGDAWREFVAAGPGSPLFRGYISLVLTCALAPHPGWPAEARGIVAAGSEAPLLRYRAGICGPDLKDMLQALRRDDTEFVDADFTLGRFALADRPPDLDEALQRVQSAAAAFPASIAALTVLGEVREEREDWAEALAAFDAVLARLPEHRDALLGRMVALSRLKRHEEAIATATHMIDLGAWFLGEAHYWRAWNEFNLQAYPAARTDTDRAKTLMVNAAVFVLSGLVEWNEHRLPTAETEFEEALKMDFGRCDAARYLGRVRVQRNKVPEALAAFKQEVQCLDLSIAVRQKMKDDVVAGPGSAAAKARQAAIHQRAIDEYQADRQEAVQNVAALEKRGTQ